MVVHGLVDRTGRKIPFNEIFICDKGSSESRNYVKASERVGCWNWVGELSSVGPCPRAEPPLHRCTTGWMLYDPMDTSYCRRGKFLVFVTCRDNDQVYCDCIYNYSWKTVAKSKWLKYSIRIILENWFYKTPQ